MGLAFVRKGIGQKVSGLLNMVESRFDSQKSKSEGSKPSVNE